MIQEIKDRVPVNVLSNDAIRYGIYNEQGNLVRYEYIKREDEPIEIGTAINKALLSNFQGDLYTQDRYNIPVITKDGDDYVFKIDLPLTSYETGKIVNIRGITYDGVKSFVNPYVNINNLGKTQVIGTIKADKYYNLVFDGLVWASQVTNIGVSTDAMIITSSGTYTVDADIQYKVIAIGGGGGAAVDYDRYHGEYDMPYGGGAGGKIEDVFVPTSDKVEIVVGSAGTNGTNSYSYSNSDGAKGTKGGNTTIGKFTAYGGGGASSHGTSEASGSSYVGSGGSYSGGSGSDGASGKSTHNSSGGYSSYYGNGGQGWLINGQYYGSGGSFVVDYRQEDLDVNTQPTQGIVVLYPLI